ncbi:hypothetical protein IP88_01880 [alpha proteobacterium AAP81b]|nr:hypothetical protein IP88_01880 [alpha proteobacterium AAP81b]
MSGADWFGPRGDGLALLQVFALASVRPLAMVALLPAMGGLALPWRARLALVAALAGFAAFAPGGRALLPGDLPGELLAGLVAGVAIALAFGAAQLAGEVAANMLGLGFAVLPGAGSASVLGGFYMLLMWCAFLGADGPLLLMAGLAEAARAAPSGLSAGMIAAQGLVLFAGALRLALPVAGLLLLGQMLVAIAGRSAPQLSSMAVGPAALLLAFAAALPMLLGQLMARSSATLAAALALF